MKQMKKQSEETFELVASILEKARTKSAAGAGGITGSAFWEMALVLGSAMGVQGSAMKWSPDTPRNVRDGLLHKGILEAVKSSAARGNPITAKALKGSIHRVESAYLKQSMGKYVLVTSVSVKPFPIRIGRRSIAGCRMTFTRNLPARFITSPLREQLDRQRHQLLPQGYTPVRVAVAARSAEEAVERALDALDLQRGIWNYGINRHTSGRIAWPTRPVNPISLGQVHSLHAPSGKLAADEPWYEQDFFEWSWGNTRDWKRAIDDESTIKRLLSRSNYRADLEGVFRRYARALDGVDFETKYLKLWALLEFLGDPDDARNVLIERCLFLFGEPEVNRMILVHLRDLRNETVHRGSALRSYEHHLFQLKRYVEALLRFHLVYSGKFETRSEACGHLDSPLAPSEIREKIARLRTQIARLRWGMKFRTRP